MRRCFSCINLKEVGTDSYVCNAQNRYVTVAEAEIEKDCPQWAAEADARPPAGRNGEFTYEIIEKYGIFDDSGDWIGQITKTSWNGRDPKIDIRYWKKDGTKSRKLGTLSLDAARLLRDILNDMKELEG